MRLIPRLPPKCHFLLSTNIVQAPFNFSGTVLSTGAAGATRAVFFRLDLEFSPGRGGGHWQGKGLWPPPGFRAPSAQSPRTKEKPGVELRRYGRGGGACQHRHRESRRGFAAFRIQPRSHRPHSSLPPEQAHGCALNWELSPNLPESMPSQSTENWKVGCRNGAPPKREGRGEGPGERRDLGGVLPQDGGREDGALVQVPRNGFSPLLPTEQGQDPILGLLAHWGRPHSLLDQNTGRDGRAG